MDAFTADLQRAMRLGGMTVSDLARWFGRDRATVREWVLRHRLPTGAREREARHKATQLRMAVVDRRGFPIPLALSPPNRAAYVTLLGEGKLARARILATRAAKRRVADRVRKKRRPAAATGVRRRARPVGVAPGG